MTFISYAQNFEDVLLNRVFKHKEKGFYIDVGALHPVIDSVTKAFYDRGWSGINIEPIKEYYHLFEIDRPRDTNLNIALSDSEGSIEFFQVVGQPGNSTLNKEIAYGVAKQKSLEVSQYNVSVQTLSSICNKYVNQKIDFLKIDVEGLEEKVIVSGDWEIFRPTVLVIETTWPNTNIRCENNIPIFLKEKNYQHVFFDGINDYYIAAESSDLVTHFNRPVNILDFYVSYRLVEQQIQINELTRILNAKNNSIRTIDDNYSQPIQSENINLLKPTIIIDSVFFQFYQTGIARVWKSLLTEWAKTNFGQHIIVLDRAGKAPKISGIKYKYIEPYDYNYTDNDREMLQQICDAEGADVFISSYYTTPLTTPSVFMAHDMIPELFDWDLNHPMWQEKHHGIRHASSFIAVSENTAKDLVKVFPEIALESITIAKNGVNHRIFSPVDPEKIDSFKHKYGIKKPYFLLVGASGGYKNSILFFKAFAQLANSSGFDIVLTGSGSYLEAQFRSYTLGSAVYMLQLSDEELAMAYSGAIALVYPSKYEGFGMPVAEAMACGCPVITCPNASLPEVAGEAAIYVKDDDVDALADALCEVQKPSIRRTLVSAGIEQAKQFSWEKMAEIVSSVLVEVSLNSLNLKEINLIIFPDWSLSEELIYSDLSQVITVLANHENSEKTTLLIDTSSIGQEEAELLLSSLTMTLLMEEELDLQGLDISSLSNLEEIQWSALVKRIHGRILLANEDKQAVGKILDTNIPSVELNSF